MKPKSPRRARRSRSDSKWRPCNARQRTCRRAGHRGFRRVAAAGRAEGGGQGNRTAEGQADRSRRGGPGGDAERDEEAQGRRPQDRRGADLGVDRVGRRRSHRDPELEAIPEGPRSVAPVIGSGESARRARVTWQKELVAHLDKHKRYPKERSQKTAEIQIPSRSTAWATCSPPTS